MNRRGRRAAKGRTAPGSGAAVPLAPAGAPASSSSRAFAEALRLHKEGRLPEAENLYVSVLSLAPAHADALHLLGALASQTGRGEAALVLIAKAISIEPRLAPYHSSLGNALRGLGRPEAAAASFRKAVDLDPRLVEARNNLGLALMDLGAFGDAADCFRAALALRVDLAEVHNNLGAAYKLQGRLDEAAACFWDALSFRPAYAEAHSNIGTVLSETGFLTEAAASFRRAVALDPAMADAHFNLSTALLSLGEMEEGWREFEWRWDTPQMAGSRRAFAQPRWTGSAGGGRRLLIHAEQGFGDTIQFCRYVPMAAALGWKVALEAQPALARLLKSLDGVDQVVPAGSPLPEFDEHCPMLSLPSCFGTVLGTVPSRVPYLAPAAHDVGAWRARLGGMVPVGPRVGIAWAGSSRIHSPAMAVVDRRRSLSREALRRVFEGCGVTFVSLQKDSGSLPAGVSMVDPMPLVSDFADTAALLSGLDLVISVDTAVAHLAGALGKPVWLLDRFDPCWRWMAGSDASPWYPSMRIYRQAAAGDWAGVLRRVAGDLRTLFGGRGADPAPSPSAMSEPEHLARGDHGHLDAFAA